MRKLHSTLLTFVIVFILFVFLIGVLLKRFGYGLSYQYTKSMPQGWYIYWPIKKVETGDIVLFKQNDYWTKYMLKRGWIRHGMFLMKKVYAGPSDFVCIQDGWVKISGDKIAKVLKKDSLGRPLPKLHFCRTLKINEYFLLSTKIANSFDSRYDGPVKRERIIANAWKVW